MDGSRLVDRGGLLDTAACPGCGERLAGPRCGRCGVDLAGAGGRRVWELSRRIAELLGERDEVIADLRREAAARMSRPAAPVPLVPAAPVQPPRSTPPPVSSPPPARSGPGVHGLLVGLGALLLAVAAVGFLVFSWRVLPLAGRATVIAVATLGVLALATWLRPRLPETAEAVGALGVVLVLSDAWAVRRTGLFGADRPEALGYAAAAAAVCAVLLGAWAVPGRVRAGSIAAAALAPAAVILAGARVADATGGTTPFVVALVAAAALAAARPALPHRWLAERVLLGLAAAGALALAAVVCASSLDLPHGSAAALLVAASVVAAAQAVAERGRGVGLRRAWSVAAGLLLGLTCAPLGRQLDQGPDERLIGWLPALAVLAVALCAAATRVPVAARRGVRPTSAAAGALAVAVLTAAPAAWVDLFAAARAALLGAEPWSLRPGVAVGSAGDREAIGTGVWLSAVAGIAAVALGALLARSLLRRPNRLATPLLVVAVAGLVSLPLELALAPRLAIAASVGLLAVLAVALGAGAGIARRRAATALPAALLLAGSAVVALVAVPAAWSVRELSVPVTVLGVAGLLLLRRPAPARARPALVAAASAAGLVVAAAAAGLLDHPMPGRLTVAGVAAAALAALAGSAAAAPRAGLPLRPAERAAALAVALGGVIAGLAGSYAEVDLRGDVPAGQQVLPAALLLAALVLVIRPCRGLAELVDVRPPAAFAAAPLAALLATFVVRDPLPDAEPGVVIGAVTTLACLAIAAVALLREPHPSGRVAAEAGTALVGLYALFLAVAAVTPEAHVLWVTLLLVGAGAAAIAGAPDRRPVGWVAGVLLTASTWSRLWLGDVGVVEAYALPPAAALLVFGAVRLRREPAADPARVLWSGLSVALLPSVLVAGTGTLARPVLLLAAAALAVAVAAVPRAARVRRTALVTGTVVALAVAAIRPLAAYLDRGVLPAGSVEPWSLPAAAVIVAAALVARRREPRAADPLAALALAVAVTPTLLAAVLPAAAGDVAVARAAGALAIPAAVLLALLWRLRGSALDRLPLLHRAAVAAAVAAAAAGVNTGLSTGSGPVEAWTLPLAALLLAAGGVRLPGRDTGSWPALGPGLAVLLLPSLLLALGDEPDWRRSAGLVLLGAAAVVAGAVRRLQAPLLAGAGVLAVHAVVHLWPYVAAAYQQAPLWGTLATVGALLLVFGATYERRVRQLNRVRLRLAALR